MPEGYTVLEAWDCLETKWQRITLARHGLAYKKRVAVGGRGKSGGVRTLLAYQIDDKAFFIYGFANNVRANIKDDELKALKRYAQELLGYGEKELTKVIKHGASIEVENNG